MNFFFWTFDSRFFKSYKGITCIKRTPKGLFLQRGIEECETLKGQNFDKVLLLLSIVTNQEKRVG